MLNRRQFIEMAGMGTAAFSLRNIPFEIMEKAGLQKLTILHTNDVHSHVYPFTSGRNKGLGGAARRAALIQKIRAQEQHVLLFDAGDIFQGTPYFNFYGGELEMKLMSEMEYDAATIGNHDFDAGIEGFEKQLKHASFPFVCGNYCFDDTVMKNKTRPYTTFKKGNIKVGVFGLGIELDGLVPKSLYKETTYLDPMKFAKKISTHLKFEEKCDLVILLSHLGYRYRDNKVSDQTIAAESKYIDIIIGGHTHSFLPEPEVTKNVKGNRVLINQVGFAGINLGRMDIYFEKGKVFERLVEGKPVLVK